ncbi:MAG TPA: hypothetical protein VKT71_06630 [Candidatus Acidoferrales bacterium]|nr:hypothetical protein [Candidatus Acidoferrales bacterium]
MPTTLYRPIGLQELALLWDSGMREFPPRLIQQPIFYPVVNLEYARQIARDWNTPDANSGFAGFVTRFDVSSTYLTKYELHTAGSSTHREYWIPAREMTAFNKAINRMISVEEAYFGREFSGYVPDDGNLKGQNAVAQYAALSNLVDFAAFSAEVSASRKAVFLNCRYWFDADLVILGGTGELRYLFFTKLAKAWKANKIKVPLPIAGQS